MVYLSVDLGFVSIEKDSSIRSILDQYIETATQNAKVRDADGILVDPSNRQRILDAIFLDDASSFVSGDHGELQSGLGEQERARLVVQGIAGILSLLFRLARVEPCISQQDLDAELHAFTVRGIPTLLRQEVEESRIFSDCLMKTQLADLILAAARMGASHPATTDCLHKTDISWEDYQEDAFGSTYSRPPRNMGQPWGFTIMAIN